MPNVVRLNPLLAEAMRQAREQELADRAAKERTVAGELGAATREQALIEMLRGRDAIIAAHATRIGDLERALAGVQAQLAAAERAAEQAAENARQQATQALGAANEARVASTFHQGARERAQADLMAEREARVRAESLVDAAQQRVVAAEQRARDAEAARLAHVAWTPPMVMPAPDVPREAAPIQVPTSWRMRVLDRDPNGAIHDARWTPEY